MNPRFETRRDFKEAGRSFAREACDAAAVEIERVSVEAPAELTNEFVDGLTARMMLSLDRVVASHLEAGSPVASILLFRSAFLQAASQRCRDFSIAARRPPGRA